MWLAIGVTAYGLIGWRWSAPAAAVLELRYGSPLDFNQVLVFTPEGELAFTYQKTKSRLPVEADGRLHSLETPYGTVSTAICFDMDFPAFIRQAARAGTSIRPVPAFDSERIRPFHTEPALLRGIEGGFAVVRQVNHGTSMAADAEGTVLARQDYFVTADRVMLADVPTEGCRTLYGLAGDWFTWASILLLAFLVVAAVRQPRRLDQPGVPRSTEVLRRIARQSGLWYSIRL